MIIVCLEHVRHRQAPCLGPKQVTICLHSCITKHFIKGTNRNSVLPWTFHGAVWWFHRSHQTRMDSPDDVPHWSGPAPHPSLRLQWLVHPSWGPKWHRTSISAKSRRNRVSTCWNCSKPHEISLHNKITTTNTDYTVSLLTEFWCHSRFQETTSFKSVAQPRATNACPEEPHLTRCSQPILCMRWSR